MPRQVNAFGKMLSFPDDMTEEQMLGAIKANEHLLNPDYKQPLMEKAKGFARDVFGYSQPSIAEQAEATAPDSAEVVAPQMRGAPVRQSVYNKALVDQLPGDESTIQDRINKTASADLSGQRLQSGIKKSITDSAPESSGFSGLVGGVARGAKQTGRMVGAAIDTLTENLSGVERYADESVMAMQRETPIEQKALIRDLSAIDREQGVIGQIGDALSAAKRRPMGTAQFVVEQAPNAAVSLGAGYAGFKTGATAGAFVGPMGAAIGGTLGFLSGMFLGNYLLEAGGKAIDKAVDEDGFTRQDKDAAIKEGAIKAAAITGVDALTFKLGGMITQRLGKSAINAGARAEAEVLMKAGVDMSSLAAINAALKNSPELFNAARMAGEKASLQSLSLTKRAGIVGTGLTAETLGEGVGEYVGEYAATGKPDVVDATMEALSGLTQSSVQAAYNFNKLKAGNDLSPEGIYKAVGSINEHNLKEGIGKINAAASVDEAINAANEVVSQKPTTKDDVLRSVEPTLADIERLTGLKPSETIETAINETQKQVQKEEDLLEPSQTLKRETASWVIVNKETNEAMFETYDKNKVNALNTSKYKAVPILEYLQGINKKIKESSRVTNEIVLPDNSSIPYQWDVVDADQIKATLKNGQNQPRDRTRAASDVQIQSIAKQPDYRRLSESPILDVGAPVITADNAIVAGNGRFEALDRAYGQGTHQKYLESLINDLPAKGVDPQVIQGMKKPVLVRRLTQPVDTRKLAVASNSGGGLQYSSLELAGIDASRMQGLDNLDFNDLGELSLNNNNYQTLKRAFSGYNAEELAAMQDAKGMLSQDGMRRVRNAVLAKAYGDGKALGRLIDTTDNNLRNVLGALTKAASTVAKTKSMIDSGAIPRELDVTENFLDAVDVIHNLKSRNIDLTGFLSQKNIFGDGIDADTREILQYLNDNIRSQKKLTEFIKNVYGTIASIDTRTDNIFGDNALPTKQEVLRNAKTRTDQPIFAGLEEDQVVSNATEQNAVPKASDVKGGETPNFSRDAKDRIKSLEKTRKLQKSFDQEGYGLTAKAADVRDFIANDGRKRNEAIASEQIAKAFGKRVTWIDVTGEFDINGVVVPSIKDTIFIDIKTNKAAHAVLGHELSHHMEYDAPQAYKDMLAALDPLIKDHEGYAKAKEIDGASRDFLIKEIVGDLIGDNFTNQKFWNKVAEHNPSAFKRIADVINTWISRLLDNIRGRGLGSEKWVTDIEKAQDIIAKAVSEYVGNTGQQSAQSDTAMFQKAWHGSPHDHNKFDASKIGTGEGVQAYGFGHYFADSKEVAEWYKDKFEQRDSSWVGEGLLLYDRDYVALALQKNYSISEFKNNQEKLISPLIEPKNALKVFKEFNRGNIPKTRSKLYEVELAPEQDEYLLWDKPLSEQSEKVRNAIKNINKDDMVYYDNFEQLALAALFREHPRTKSYDPAGADLYRDVSDANGSKQSASEYLHSLGIRGIKYLDGTSRSKGEGSYNYVIFDDKNIEIPAKFSKADSIPETIKELEESWDARGISNFIYEKNGVITLSRIVIPKEQRNKGIGTSAMNELISYADKTGQRIALSPSGDFGGSKSRLLSFYKKFGFVENTGRKKDYSISESMYRDPSERAQVKDASLQIPETINIDGVDRPTRNSEGKLIHPAEEGIRNFWKWFGDSKVVDEQGRPLVVYHGTAADFSEFNAEFMYAGEGASQSGSGFYFTTDKESGSNYALMAQEKKDRTGGNVTPVYLALNKPLHIDFMKGEVFGAGLNLTKARVKKIIMAAPGINDADGPLSNFGDVEYEGFNRVLNEAVDVYAGGNNIAALRNDFYGDDHEAWLRALKAATGYDSAKSVTPSGSTHYVAWNPNQIKSAIGNTGAFSDNTDIRFSFAGEKSEAESNAPEQEQENTLPKETAFRKFQREWQDDFNRFQVFKDWLNERGIQLSEKADVSLAEERFHAKVANQIEDFRDFTVSPLIERIAKAGFTMQDVADFLEAQHASEANEQIQKLYDDPSKTAYGVTDEEAEAYLDKAPEELKTLANEFRDITEKAKKLRLDNGLLNTDITGAWESTYKHYIPVKGAEEKPPGSGKGLSVKFKPKRRLGHGRRDEAVVENIIHDYERAVYEVEKNRVGKHLAMMAAEINLPELMTIDAPVKRKVLKNVTAYQVTHKGVTVGVFDSMEAAKTFKQAFPLVNKKVGIGELEITKTTDQRIAAMASPMLADNEINVYIDGHAIRLQINDELAARAYKKLGVEGFGKLVAAGRALNGYLSKVYTGYNPEFILKNLQRDFQTGLLNLTGEEGMMMAAKAAYNYPKMFADLFRYAVSNRKKSTKWIDQYRATGGNTGAAYLSDMERLGKEVATEYAAYQGVMANLKQGKPGFAARAAGKKAYNVFLKWIYNMNQASENAMRLAAFKAMIDSGKTENEAAHIAKNITVNFNRKGENGQIANAAWLFFNASVQGQAATMHALFKGKHKGQAWALASAYTTIGYLAAASLGGGDEDDYDKIDDYTKERNLLISTGDGGWVKLAVPYGYGFFYNTGRVLADAQRKDELGVLPWHIMASAIEEMTPFGDIVVGSDEQFKMDQMLLGILPTALKIPSQVAFNKQLFSGSELMPSSDFDESQPDRDKMFRGTKGTVYDNLAGLLENIGFDVSPETLKYSFRTGTGGAGALVDTTISATMLKSQGAELDPGEIPFIRTMYHENNVRADRAAFHKARKEAQTTAEELQRAIKKNDFAKVSEITKDKVEMLMMDKYADKLRKLISIERDAQDSVRLDPSLTAAEKRLKLKEMEKRESAFYDQYLDVFKTKKAEMKAREN